MTLPHGPVPPTSATPANQSSSLNPDSPGERIAAAISHWDALGVHRTGSDVDTQTAQWLCAKAAEYGAEAHLEAFPFRRRTVIRAAIELANGTALEGVPAFDGGSTGDNGLVAPLGDAQGGIPIMRVPPFDALPGARSLEDARHSGLHAAIIAVTDDRTVMPGLALLNAESWHAPYGPPVLQLPSTALAALAAAQAAGSGTDGKAEGAEARLDLRFEIEAVTAFNVHAQVRGRDPSLAPVVVITPRSGWWHATSERGGGIAIWLDLIAHLASMQPLRTVIFSANTGHELGHLGMQRFLDENEALVAGAHGWLHLGANIAASSRPQLRLQASDADMMALADAALSRHGAPPMVRTDVTSAPFGEARDIHAGGGRFISMVGGNGVFHQPSDRWPDMVDLARTLDIALAFREMLDALAYR